MYFCVVTRDTVDSCNSNCSAISRNTSGRIAVNGVDLSLKAASLSNVDGHIEHAGTGTLILDQANTATGALGITNAGAVVQLGTEAKAGQWAGTVLNGEGTLKIVNGALTSAMTRAAPPY